MEFENLLKLVKAVSDSSLTGFKYEENGVKISMQSEKIQVVPEDKPAALAAVPTVNIEVEEKAAVEGTVVQSPLVGTFYAAPAEDADPFVKVGDAVKKGQTLAIVEAMKLMNEIEAEIDGTVAEIYAVNAKAVEYGEPLFRIV